MIRRALHSSPALHLPRFKQADKRLARKLLSYGNYDIMSGPCFDSNGRSPTYQIPSSITRPSYALPGGKIQASRQLTIKTPADITQIRQACQLAAKVLKLAGQLAQPGMKTSAIDEECFKMIVGAGAYPSPFGYEGYPRSICTSVNNVICHGIPDDRPLCDGDIVSIDVTVFLKGFHGDNCGTFLVGDGVDEQGKQLVNASRQAVFAGIQQVRPDQPISAIGMAIDSFARPLGYSIVRELCGHGIGTDFHELPYIHHYYDSSVDQITIMRPGMVFTVEPVLCQGFPYMSRWEDGWTLATVDNSRGAQWEHTVLVTDDGYEILTDLN
jgi:methionyl aminopeptidase